MAPLLALRTRCVHFYHGKDLPAFRDIDIKYATAEKLPFHHAKSAKREIVTIGRRYYSPEQAGIYVEPKDWNALISDPDVLVVDTRNDYEVAIGQFEGADNPLTQSFRPFQIMPHKL